MFGHIARLITILGGGCAVLVAGEIMLGERSTRLSPQTELRAMQHSPGLADDMSLGRFCIQGDCDVINSAIDQSASALKRPESSEEASTMSHLNEVSKHADEPEVRLSPRDAAARARFKSSLAEDK